MEKFILTDYIDGKLKAHLLEEVELHLRSCPSCNALAEELRAAGKLFKTVGQEAAPREVWHKILAEINAAPAKNRFAETILMYMRYYLSHLKPAVVIASAAVLLFFALTAIRFMPHGDYPGTMIAQDDILAIPYTSDEEDGSEYDFETPAEMFFL